MTISSIKLKSQAFLCGYFSINSRKVKDIDGKLKACCWEKKGPGKENPELLSNFYYPEFVNFCTNLRSVYRYRVDADFHKPYRFGVTDIELGIYPMDIVVFRVALTFSDCTVEHMCNALSRIRNCCFYENAGLDDFIDSVLGPVKKAYAELGGTADTTALSCPYLVENGNKFKLFQIVETDSLPQEENEMNKFLYSCGTLSEYDENKLLSISSEYFEKSLREGRLSVFNNWKALMLLDSVTFVSLPLSGFTRSIWINDYFAKIYLYELYHKIYLYRLNLRFRSGEEKPSRLSDEMKLFERKYMFSSLSFNFLPNEISMTIEKNLRTREVESEIYHVIDQEVAAQIEEHDSRSNLFLTFLTLMASLSAVWDTSSMVDALVNYEKTFDIAATGYRLVVTLLIIVILLAALFSRHKKNR